MPTEELFGSYNFLLEISGITGDAKTIVGGFKSMSGMDSETEVVEFKQGNDKVVRKKPGRTEFQRAILGRNSEGRPSVRLTGSQGAGILRSMSEANCFVILGHDQGNVEAGEWVDIALFDGLL